MVDYAGSYATPRLDLGQALWEFRDGPMDFVATRCLPVFSTPKKAASFSALTRAMLMQSADTKRAPRGGYNRIDTGAKDLSYSCDNHGLEGLVDDSERELYRSDFDHEMATAWTVDRAVRLAQEQRVSALLFNTTTWTGASLYTDVSAAPWTTAGSDVIGQIADAKELVRQNTGMKANAVIFNESNLQELLRNTGIIARFPGAGDQRAITPELLKANLALIFDVEQVIIAPSTYNSAEENESQTVTVTDVWSSTYAMVARIAPQGSPLSTPGLGRTMLWQPYSPELFTVESYREEQTESDVIRVKHHVDEVVYDEYFAHLLKVR